MVANAAEPMMNGVPLSDWDRAAEPFNVPILTGTSATNGMISSDAIVVHEPTLDRDITFVKVPQNPDAAGTFVAQISGTDVLLALAPNRRFPKG